ncbi:MAG: 3-deoxy-manno-octulosonate cytidylyltransferase [Helicobacteraceae bacterium]|nr:3-deoxy-manno-octulosonate cytidylyltransferase [Helicobacteraceae bacterium]
MIIIPARLHSTRLPNKLLLPLGGIPIIIRTANIAREIDSTIVACDSEEIVDICKKHNIDCILTSKEHTSGTDRCAEAAEKLKLDDDEVVVNLQGDEPFIESSIIENLKQSMNDAIRTKSAFMVSCYKEIDSTNADDSNLVKVVLDNDNFALYFSRSKIPYNRDNVEVSYFGHIGIYAFSAKSLSEFCNFSKSQIEDVEKLEQLRVLWYGKKILMIKVETKSIGIDTKIDYENALKLIGAK